MKSITYLISTTAYVVLMQAPLLVSPCVAAETVLAEPAFSPDAGAEEMVLRAIDQARDSIRILAYSFTAMPVAKALIAAHRRGVNVAVTVDYRENVDDDRSGRARAALSAMTAAGIVVRTVATLTVHSKYMIVDGETVETGSYNYSQQAAHYNAENAVLLTGSTAFATRYLRDWTRVSALGTIWAIR